MQESLSRRLSYRNEVTAIAWDPNYEAIMRLVTGTLTGNVSLWTFSKNRELNNIFSVTVGTTVPRNVAFGARETGYVYVFGAWNGVV